MSENKFTTPSRTEIYQDMVKYYQDKYSNSETAITDFAEGSEIAILLNSICVELEQLYVHDALLCDQKFIKTAVGYYLDLLACEYHVSRNQGTQAYTDCTFTLKGNLRTSNYTIPANTGIVHRKDGTLKYYNPDPVTIPAGSYSATGRVIAEQTGKKYNTSTKMLTSFSEVSRFANYVSVTNNYPVSGGSDTESDDDLREKILNAKRNQTFGTISWYTTQLTALNEVHDVAFINPEYENIVHQVYNTKTNTAETCTECTRIVYVNADSKPCPDDVCKNVMAYLENQSNLVIGHKFHVEPAKVKYLYLEITAYCTGTVNEDEIFKVLTCYFDGGTYTNNGTSVTYGGLNIGETVQKWSLFAALEHIPEVEQVTNINELKYNEKIGSEADHWDQVGNEELYEYTDDNGYTFQARGKTISDTNTTFDYWGKRNYISTVPAINEVVTLGNMEDQYPNTQTTDTDWREEWSERYNTSYTRILFHNEGQAERDGTYSIKYTGDDTSD